MRKDQSQVTESKKFMWQGAEFIEEMTNNGYWCSFTIQQNHTRVEDNYFDTSENVLCFKR